VHVAIVDIHVKVLATIKSESQQALIVYRGQIVSKHFTGFID